jgi:dihydrofolate reductase
MRKIIVLAFVTLDGIMQAPGGPEEDTSGGFKYGGWVAPYADGSNGQIMAKLLQPTDLLLGRKTFDVWEGYWPTRGHIWQGINEVTKYVLSSTKEKSDWNNSVFLKNVSDIQKLKDSEGDDIKVWGSSELVHLLLEHDLIDEFWLQTHPIILGKGKRLFDNSSAQQEFKLDEHFITQTE